MTYCKRTLTISQAEVARGRCRAGCASRRVYGRTMLGGEGVRQFHVGCCLPAPAIVHRNCSSKRLVLKVLEPIWTKKPETASRVRGRMEAVLDWAKARGYRTGENPARWKGHLDHLLPARSKVLKTDHYAAMPYKVLPGFLIELRNKNGIDARALDFTILTAARVSEVVGARWSEISGDLWTIPAERMKGGKEHR